jgi:deoxyribodipyrimidine photo-lyase
LLCTHRAKFLLESVADLKARLRGIGSDLAVAVGRPEEVIPGGWVGGWVIKGKRQAGEER